LYRKKGIGTKGLLLPLFTLLVLLASTAHAAPNNSGAFFTWAGITYVK
jgi:hypothetical protein